MVHKPAAAEKLCGGRDKRGAYFREIRESSPDNGLVFPNFVGALILMILPCASRWRLFCLFRVHHWGLRDLRSIQEGGDGWQEIIREFSAYEAELRAGQ